MTLVSFDYAMKKILREKVNFDILEGFLSELLSTKIKIKSLLESESNKDSKNDKQNRVDLLAEDGDKKLLLIEVQKSYEIDYFQRMAFAASRLITEYIENGQSYGHIRKVITVNIVYFELGQGDDYIYHGTTHFHGLHKPNDVLKPSFDQMERFGIKTVKDIFPEHWIIKLKKFDNKTRDKLDEWIYFLKNSKIEKGFSAKGLDRAKIKLDELRLSLKDRDAYRIYLKNLRDEASFALNALLELEREKAKGKAEGLEAGRAEGLEAGRAEALLLVAKKLKQRGFSIEIIMEDTGLSREEVENL